jgi:hypothetical protein
MSPCRRLPHQIFPFSNAKWPEIRHKYSTRANSCSMIQILYPQIILGEPVSWGFKQPLLSHFLPIHLLPASRTIYLDNGKFFSPMLLLQAIKQLFLFACVAWRELRHIANTVSTWLLANFLCHDDISSPNPVTISFASKSALNQEFANHLKQFAVVEILLRSIWIHKSRKLQHMFTILCTT